MTTTWPLEMSRLILDYAGYIQTAAQIARDEVIELKARQQMPNLALEVQNINSCFRRSDDDFEDEADREQDFHLCIEPSFVVDVMRHHRDKLKEQKIQIPIPNWHRDLTSILLAYTGHMQTEAEIALDAHHDEMFREFLEAEIALDAHHDEMFREFLEAEENIRHLAAEAEHEARINAYGD